MHTLTRSSSVCFLWLVEPRWRSRQMDGWMLGVICVEGPWGCTRRVSCGFFSDATSHMLVFMLVFVVVCPSLRTRSSLICECASWSHETPLTQSASALVPEGAHDGAGTRPTLPTQHQKLLMSYCCTLLWNIIALWCVNKAGACCHSICSPAGQTGTTSRERRWWGAAAERKGPRGSSWSVAVEHRRDD